MSLFTFIIDYKGGTYISQVEDEISLQNACNKWIEQLNPNDIYGFGEKSKSLLKKDLSEAQIMAINGVDNVWCFISSIRKTLLLVNIVKTAEIQNPKSEIPN